MYAIVDIETTGGYAGKSKITEIAVFVHDGERVVDKFQTLVNPQQTLPPYITGLTGITQKMVDAAPPFADIAAELYHLLENKIFVAHNVSFDFSFIKKAFEEEGFQFYNRKLCTVRLSRQAFPNLRSYSLGNLCESLGIFIEDRHRAGGDAQATTILFEKILSEKPDAVRNSLKHNSKETSLPPNLPKNVYYELPESAGVYYFFDAQGEVIYVGKAVNIKKRITSHFSGTSKDSRNQSIRNEIHHIDYELTGNELLALILESQEIKRLWPKYNRSQKYRPNQWGIYQYEDQQGYIRLNVSKKVKGVAPLIDFNSHADGFHFLLNKVKEFSLCPKLSGIQKTFGACYDHAIGHCQGACIEAEPVAIYNTRIEAAKASFMNRDSTFAIVGEGRSEEERSFILVENGKYHGFGYCDRQLQIASAEDVKMVVKQYKSTIEIENYIQRYTLDPTVQVVPL